MPKETNIKKVLVIGSGPIVIGQAAEFDYAGTQACLALKEEGCEVILVNNNPATIMTDHEFADVVYFEPLTVETLIKIIEKEQPDGLLATLGGQTGLNLALKLHERGLFERYNVKLLGTPIESIIQGEDREAFRALMHELNEPVPESEIVANIGSALAFAEKVGYPIIVRPAYTLGGSGGGVAHNQAELETFVNRGLNTSPIKQCLIEESIAGFKEIELEILRDENDTCISICHLENIDPVGIHTGDSIVVAPSQTLTNKENHMLRTASVKIIRALGIVGACNVQFALDPESKQYFLIEVNPRVSRSSALASKATGYPIARIATKLSLGYHLHELTNPLTNHTYASFEPILDYVVVKFPRWPFDTFSSADRSLGTQMKATGEVMAIERNLESAFQKAIRSLDVELNGLSLVELEALSSEQLWQLALHADDRRFFVLLELLRRGETPQVIHEATKINLFYLDCLHHLIKLEDLVKNSRYETISKEQLLLLKENGFSDEWLAQQWGVSMLSVKEKRRAYQIYPSYKMVDTCGGEFHATTDYYYSSWQGESDVELTNKPKILIVGSGPIRIGQGIEFDYCTVHGVLALKKYGYETILINNNPETVSTDYEMADRLYFEPLTVEDVLNVIEFENVEHVIVQFGGQTAISLVAGLEEAGVTLLGSTQDVIDQLEDRDRFYQLMKKLNLPHIPGLMANNQEELRKQALDIGFPILLRPSYVIGGKGMIVLTNRTELENYVECSQHEKSFPILIDAYYPGKEVEVDVVTDGKDIVIPGIFEHIEKAGVHSGDSVAVTPPFSLSNEVKQLIYEYARTIANGIQFKGIFNIQFVLHDDNLYVLEVNPRASRTAPLMSKITNVNLIALATAVLIGKPLATVTSHVGLLSEIQGFAVKAPIFSTVKLPGLDPQLTPEMKSTGEVIALADTLEACLTKAFLWNEQIATAFMSRSNEIYLDCDSEQLIELFPALNRLGFKLVSEQSDIKEQKIGKQISSFKNWLKLDKSFAIISFSSENEKRQLALQYGLTVMSSLETVKAFAMMTNETPQVHAIRHQYKADQKEVSIQ